MPFASPDPHWQVAMPKTQISRFQIHDELTAPEGSLPVLKGACSSAGQLPNFLGVLAGSPAALRGYTRFRGELRHGTLRRPTLERIALAVAEHYHSVPGVTIHSRTARQAGVGIDEVARAREWDSNDPPRRRCCAICKALLTQRGAVRTTSTRRHGRPAGATSSSSKPLRCSAWNPSRRWSTSPARFPWTAPSRRRGCSAPHKPWRASGQPTQGCGRDSRPSGGPTALLPPFPPGGRAGRQALDRGDPLRAASRRPGRCASRRSRTPCRICRTGCCRSG